MFQETLTKTSIVSSPVREPRKEPQDQNDLYIKLKTLERKLEFLEIQEEYIKDEVKNLKRELLRAQEEVRAFFDMTEDSSL